MATPVLKRPTRGGTGAVSSEKEPASQGRLLLFTQAVVWQLIRRPLPPHIHTLAAGRLLLSRTGRFEGHKLFQLSGQCLFIDVPLGRVFVP